MPPPSLGALAVAGEHDAEVARLRLGEVLLVLVVVRLDLLLGDAVGPLRDLLDELLLQLLDARLVAQVGQRDAEVAQRLAEVRLLGELLLALVGPKA